MCDRRVVGPSLDVICPESKSEDTTAVDSLFNRDCGLERGCRSTNIANEISSFTVVHLQFIGKDGTSTVLGGSKGPIIHFDPRLIRR
jgi:hypothetical protein